MIKCKKHGKFEQLPTNHLQGSGCPKCSKYVSKPEIEISKWLKKIIKTNIIISDRTLLKGYELDIFLNELNLAFEFNGLFWHSEYFITKDYHYKKKKMCENMGVRLVHIYEDDWLFKKDVVKSNIKRILGLNKLVKITETKEINPKIKKDFIIKNSLNENFYSNLTLGFYSGKNLIGVALINYGKCGELIISNLIIKKGYNVGVNYVDNMVSKIKNKFKNKKIIIKLDDNWDCYSGKCSKIKIINPTYSYIYKKKRFPKTFFNKKKNSSFLKNKKKNETISEFLYKNKIYKIYDSGSILVEI